MRKRSACIAALLLAIILLSACGRVFTEGVTERPATEQPTAEAAGLPIEYEIVNFEQETDNAIRKAEYILTGIENIDQDAKALVEMTMQEQVGYPDINAQGYAEVAFSVERNDNIFSIIYAVSLYYAGAAHGITAYHTFNYLMPQAERIELSDLFSSPDYLMRLSTLSEEQLRNLDIDKPENPEESGLDADTWWYEGVSANEENFTSFVLRPDGLQLIFNVYQVAPYVVGDVRLTIPWEELQDIMDPEWYDRVTGAGASGAAGASGGPLS